MRTIRSLGASILYIAFLQAGCSDPPGEKLISVRGIVTVEGKPVRTGNVTFYPNRSKGNESRHQPMGVLDANGRYELYVPGGRKGAPPGTYKIVVYALDDPQPGKPNKYLVAKEYFDLQTTPLRIDVIEAPEPNRYDLQLKR